MERKWGRRVVDSAVPFGSAQGTPGSAQGTPNSAQGTFGSAQGTLSTSPLR